MNGVLFDILFSRSRSVAKQLSEQPEVSNVREGSTLHAENLLTEEFHHASISAYQAKEEIINTFNTYLIATGILISGMTAILTLAVPEHGNTESLLEGLAALLLVVGAVISHNFLGRFIQLAEEQFYHLLTMDKIRTYYSDHLSIQKINIKEAFFDQGKRRFNGPAKLIRNTVILFFSLYCGGSIYIISYIITYPYLTYENYLRVISGELIFSLLVVITVGYFYMRNYSKKIERLTTEFKQLMNKS